jgi:Bacterial membrane protein YfhO
VAESGTNGRPGWTAEPPPWGWSDLAALAVWTAALLLFFRDVVFLRGALFYFDITEINYAYRDFLAREMKLGRFSRWFPGVYCGLPLFSESQAGYLHPLKFVFYPWMATWKALNLDTVTSVWLTGLGTYGWLRRHVGPKGALTGAAIFGLSGFVWAHLIHTSMNNALTSVPFAVWALEWAWSSGRRLGLVLGGLALAFQVFAGHLQDTLLTASLLGLYGLFRAVTGESWPARRGALVSTAGLIGLGVALSAVQWVPSKELLDRSPRAGGLSHKALTYGSWHPELLPALVVREAYGTRARDTDWLDGFYPYHEMNAYLGLTALALAVVGAGAARDRWVAFWIIVATLGGLLMLGKFTFVMDLAHRIPVFGSSRIPVRFHLWVSLATAALAAVGVDRLERRQGGAGTIPLRWAFGLAGTMVVASIPIMLYLYYPALTETGRWTLPYHVARFRWLGEELSAATVRTAVITLVGLSAMRIAASTRSGRPHACATAALPVVVIADLLGAHWHDVPTVPPAYWTVPPRSARMIRADPDAIRVLGMADKSAGEPGYASEPVDFMAVRDTLDWSLPPVWGLPSSNGQTPIISRRMVEYTDNAWIGAGRFEIESVTHVVTGRNSSRVISALGQGEPAGAAFVHRITRAQPRARLAGRPVYASNEKDAIAAFARLGPEIRDRVVVEDPDRPLAPEAVAAGTATITRDDPEHVEVSVDAATPAYLVLADTFDPGWTATVDARPAPIRPAWLAFRAVYLGPGRHTVAFRYRPAGFTTGLMLSVLGLIVAGGLLLRRRPPCPIGPDHAPLGWPVHWPRWGLLVVAVVLVGSVVGIGRNGAIGLQSRWSDSWHPFTWGAGIEAMRDTTPG